MSRISRGSLKKWQGLVVLLAEHLGRGKELQLGVCLISATSLEAMILTVPVLIGGYLSWW